MARMLSRFLTRIGSRAYIVGEILAIVLAAKSCGQVPAETEDGGAAGSTSTETATASDGGGGSAGSAAAGGDEGGATATAGTGGAEAGGGGSGGSSQSTTCVPTFVCGPKDCGMVDDGCGAMLDCDHAQPGDPVTCASQAWGGEGGPYGGPMTCGAEHVCECIGEGDSAEAMALCNTVMPAFCDSVGGCTTMLCGTPPVAKLPDNCGYGGAKADGSQIWCCAG